MHSMQILKTFYIPYIIYLNRIEWFYVKKLVITSTGEKTTQNWTQLIEISEPYKRQLTHRSINPINGRDKVCLHTPEFNEIEESK